MLILAAASCFLAAFLTMQVVDWISLIPWRKTVGQHWVERARVLWPIRRTSAILMLYVPLILATGCSLFWEATIGERILCWLAATAGAVGGNWFMTRELYPEIRLSSWLHDVVIGWLLRLGLWAVLLVVGFTMPEEFNARVWLTLAGVVVLQVAWPSLAIRLLRLFGILRPAEERLRKIVEDCTRDGDTRVRSIYQVRGMIANALALPLSGTLLFFDRLMEVLSDEEVAAVCAHEVGHLAESGWVIAGRYLGGMSVLPLLLIHPSWSRWGVFGLYAMVLLMFVWSRLARKLLRRMETRADAIATGQHSTDGVYANALEKLYQSNQVPAVMPGSNMIHPHLYDRMVQAGATPGFPRPLPADKFTPIGWLMLFLGPLLVAWILIRHSEFPTHSHHRDSPGKTEQVSPRDP